MEWILLIAVVLVASCVGAVFGYAFRVLLHRQNRAYGTIVSRKDGEKIVYELSLNEDTDKVLQEADEVLFEVRH